MPITQKREEITQELVYEFVNKYYTDEDGFLIPFHIIGYLGNGTEGRDLCISTVCVNESYYRNIENIWEALHHNISKDKLLERYDYQEQLNNDSNLEKSPTNLVSFRKGAPKIGLTEEELAKHKEKMKDILTLLDEECEKNKSEEYKAKEEQWKKDYLNIGNEHEGDKRVSVYDAKQALKKYHIENGEFIS